MKRYEAKPTTRAETSCEKQHDAQEQHVQNNMRRKQERLQTDRKREKHTEGERKEGSYHVYLHREKSTFAA